MEKRNSVSITSLYHEVTNQIVDLLESQKLTWDKPWIGPPRDGKSHHNALSKRPYSGMNQILLSIHQMKWQFPHSGWMTYKQVQNAGGRILPGSKASSVYYFNEVYYDSSNKLCKTEEVENLSSNQRKVIGIRKNFILMKYYVFNVTQTSGLPPNMYTLPLEVKLSEFEKDDKAESLIQSTQARIIHFISNEACYNFVNDVIFLPERLQFKGTVPYYETILHELAHWTGHSSRLNRSIKHVFGTSGYAHEELVAELCAAFLCAELGFTKCISNNAAYIHGWVQLLQSDSKYIFKVMHESETAAKFILTCGNQFNQTSKTIPEED